MGILDWLFGPWNRGSSGLYNKANQHWEFMKQALLSGDDRQAQIELLEVVRLCQESIQANPQKQGDAYVLLANALLRGSDLYQDADEPLLIKYAAACIHSWWTLPYNRSPITRHYDLGLRWYQKVSQKLQTFGSQNLEASMSEYGSLYGSLVTSPSGFQNIRAALRKDGPATESQTSDAETSGDHEEGNFFEFMAANMIRMASQQDSHGHIVLDKEKLISATLTNLEIGFALARRHPGKIRKLFVRDDGPSMKDAEIVKTEIRIWKDIALKQGSTLSRVIIVKSLSGFYGHGDEPSMELTATVMSDLEQSFELGAKLVVQRFCIDG